MTVSVPNQWSATFSQPAAFGTTPPALQSISLALTPANSTGGGTGSPTAGNWLIVFAGPSEPSATSGFTVGVKDDIHSYWRPAKVSAAAALTRTSCWYTANTLRVPGYVYISPNGAFDALTVNVLEVSGLGPWDTITGVSSAYAAAATALTLSLPAPSATSAVFAAVTGDSTAAGQAFTPASWTALHTVSATNGVDNTCDSVLTSAFLPSTSGSVLVSASATSATDLSGVIVGFQITAPSPVPGGNNPNWPYLILEAAFGSGFETPEDQMVWASLNNWVNQGSIRRFWAMSDQSGVPYALGQLQSSTGGYQLDNFDGALCPWNVGSPYYSLSLNANMSFQSGVSPWTATGSATLAQSSAHVFASASNGISAASLQVTPNGTTATPGAQSEQFAVAGSTAYSASAWFYSVAGYATGAQVAISWYTSGHALISTSTSSALAIPAATWTQVTNLNVTSPSNAAFAAITVQFAGTPAATAFWVAEAALVLGSSAVATGLVTTGTPVRVRAALGTIKGTVYNRWHILQRNALAFPEKRNTKTTRNYVPLTTTDIWSVAGTSCPTPYRGEVRQDSPQSWWPMDDQPLSGGVQPVSLRNSAAGNTNVLTINAASGGVTAGDSYSTTGTDLTTANAPGAPTIAASVAVYSVAAQQGWMYGDPQASPASYNTGNPVTASPGSAAWQQTGLLGSGGSNGWFMTANDSSFPALSSGMSLELWWNPAFFGSATGFTSAANVRSDVAGQPYSQITLATLATASAPVAILYLDISGHLILETFNGGTGTNHTIYSSSDLRSASWHQVVLTTNGSTWNVYLDGGLTASVSGSGAGMTSAWTWLVIGADLGASGGSTLSAATHMGNVAYSHAIVYPSILPAWRVTARYAAAITGFGLLPAPQTVSLSTVLNKTPGIGYTPDGSLFNAGNHNGVSGSGYGSTGAAVVTYTFSGLAVAQAGSYTSGPSARAIIAGLGNGTGGIFQGNAVWMSFTSLAPSVGIYTAASANAELNAATVCGSGDSFSSGFGSGASGSGVCQTAAGTNAAPPASASSLGDSTAQRIERILGYGLVTAPNRAIDYTASLLVQAALDVGGQQAGASVQAQVDSDNGLLFVDTGNTLCYKSRAHLAADQAAAAAWNIGMNVDGAGQIPFADDITWGNDPTRVYDVIALTPYSPDGASLPALVPANAAAANAAQLQYGPKPKSITSYLQDQTKIQAAANWWLSTFGGIRRRAEVVTIDAATHPAGWGMFFATNIGDVVTLFDQPFSQPTTNGTYRISNIARSVSNGANGTPVEGKLKLVLDPVPASYWS